MTTPSLSDEELAEIAARYDSLYEFRNKEANIYSIISHRGLVKKLCAHMDRMDSAPVTNEYLAKVAAKYDSLPEFRVKESAAYARIVKRGLLDKLCGHMERSDRGAIPEENLAAVAAKYDVLIDFIYNEPNTYAVIRRRGLLDKLCGHMKREQVNMSREEAQEIASRYTVLKEFREKESHAYRTITHYGLLNELCGHMEHTSNATPLEELAAIAAKYDTLRDFRNKEGGAYSVILRRGLIDELCAHMKRSGNWARRKIYVFTFSDGYAYVGLTCNPEKRYYEHTSGKYKSAVYSHIKKSGVDFDFLVLTDWLGIDDARSAEEGYIKKYKGDGWKMLNRARGGALGAPNGGYTRHMLKLETERYGYIEDFKDNSPRYYKYIMKNNLFDEFCSHMKHRA